MALRIKGESKEMMPAALVTVFAERAGAGQLLADNQHR
jgi:hypothetical protein